MNSALRKYLGGDIDFSPEHEELINSYFKPLATKRNQVLVEKGTVARDLYFVIKGCLRIFLTDEQGNESTRFLIFEQSMGTAFPSFILRQP